MSQKNQFKRKTYSFKSFLIFRKGLFVDRFVWSYESELLLLWNQFLQRKEDLFYRRVIKYLKKNIDRIRGTVSLKKKGCI